MSLNIMNGDLGGVLGCGWGKKGGCGGSGDGLGGGGRWAAILQENDECATRELTIARKWVVAGK